MMRIAPVFLSLLIIGWGIDQAGAAVPTAQEQASMGLTALKDRLGNATPTGAGITATQVEAPRTTETEYYVNASHPDFVGKSITDVTGGGTVSSHATNVGQNFYGKYGVAPGVSTVDVYNANDWMDGGFLKTQTAQAPNIETRDIENHSWIGNFTLNSLPDVARATDVLRRIDYVVNRDGVVVVAGVNNGSTTAIPQIIGNAYNVISVGRSDGLGSLGPSTVDVIGRSKPDIVAAGYNVSVATSWVSGAAAILLQEAGSNASASRPETIKAVLLAGASKAPFDTKNITASLDDNWTRTPVQPLDLRYGAGQLNIDASDRILAAGDQTPSNIANVARTGWDFNTVNSGNTVDYFFNVPAHYAILDFSTIATWNRQISFTPGAGALPATFTPTLANVDIQLFSASNFSKSSLVDESRSLIDNVEHIYQRYLPSGQYAISVKSNQLADFALAWTSKLVLEGDANGDGMVDGADYTIWANNFSHKNAAYSEGDFNQDGIVDGADYTIWANNFSAKAASLPAMAVPEPSTLVLGFFAGTFCLLSLRRNLRRRS